MLTSIENNIKLHFLKYINRFINAYFKHLYKEEIKVKSFKDEMFKELKVLKNDINNGTTLCNPKYHKWLDEYRFQIVPRVVNVSHSYDVKADPQQYLKYMIFMNIKLEEIQGKMYQFFPLQTDIIPKHIQIETAALVDLFIEENLKTYIKNIELYQKPLWDKFFNITQHLSNDYLFDYTIITDGYAASIRFIQKDAAIKKKDKKKK